MNEKKIVSYKVVVDGFAIGTVEAPEGSTQYERDQIKKEFCNQNGLKIPTHYARLKRIT